MAAFLLQFSPRCFLRVLPSTSIWSNIPRAWNADGACGVRLRSKLSAGRGDAGYPGARRHGWRHRRLVHGCTAWLIGAAVIFAVVPFTFGMMAMSELESHLAKSRSLLPKLALIFHLAADGRKLTGNTREHLLRCP